MLKSMTGFATHSVAIGSDSLSIEVKSVNHKFCEVKVRVPRELASAELNLVKLIKERVSRGAIDLWVKKNTTAGATSRPTLDLDLASEYWNVFQKLKNHLQLSQEPRLHDVLSQQGVLRLEETIVDLGASLPLLERAVLSALASLEDMRTLEGASIYSDLSARLDKIEQNALALQTYVPQAVADYQARLLQKVKELTESSSLEPQRLAQEVALMAERIDVSEELVRLRSHIGQFRELMVSELPVGRKLDFLVQEMHREINTTGSKSQSSKISSLIVELKAELERIREQVQNIE